MPVQVTVHIVEPMPTAHRNSKSRSSCGAMACSRLWRCPWLSPLALAQASRQHQQQEQPARLPFAFFGIECILLHSFSSSSSRVSFSGRLRGLASQQVPGFKRPCLESGSSSTEEGTAAPTRKAASSSNSSCNLTPPPPTASLPTPLPSHSHCHAVYLLSAPLSRDRRHGLLAHQRH